MSIQAPAQSPAAKAQKLVVLAAETTLAFARLTLAASVTALNVALADQANKLYAASSPRASKSEHAASRAAKDVVSAAEATRAAAYQALLTARRTHQDASALFFVKHSQ